MVYPCTHPSYVERACPAFNAAEALTVFGASHPLSEVGGAILVLGHRESVFFPLIYLFVFSLWVCMHMPVTIRWQLAGLILSFSHVGSGEQTQAIRFSGKYLLTEPSCWLAQGVLRCKDLLGPGSTLLLWRGKPAQYAGLQTHALCLMTHGLFVGFGLSQCLDIWFVAIKF